jgi:hypothetical protein
MTVPVSAVEVDAPVSPVHGEDSLTEEEEIELLRALGYDM